MTDTDKVGIPEFLHREGSLGVILRLDDQDGLINKEIQKLVHVTPTTLSSRLKDGKSKNLIKEINLPTDHGNAQRYRLTERGQALKDKLIANGTNDAYEEFLEAHIQLQHQKSELKKWAETADINDPRWPPDHEPEDDYPDT